MLEMLEMLEILVEKGAITPEGSKMGNSDKDDSQFRLLKAMSNTEDQEYSLRFLQLTGDFTPDNPSLLPPSPRELSCINPPEWINEDLTLNLKTWVTHIQANHTINEININGDIDSSNSNPNHLVNDKDENLNRVDRVVNDYHVSPLDWATNLILLDLIMTSSKSLDFIAKQRIKIREDLNRVMIRTLTEESVCPINKLGSAGLKLLHLDGSVTTNDDVTDTTSINGLVKLDNYESVGVSGLTALCYDKHEDHKDVMAMISDFIKEAYSVTSVQELGDLRGTAGWGSLELKSLHVLDSMDMNHNVANAGDLKMVSSLLDVLIPVFCPDASKCQLILEVLSNAMIVHAY